MSSSLIINNTEYIMPSLPSIILYHIYHLHLSLHIILQIYLLRHYFLLWQDAIIWISISFPFSSRDIYSFLLHIIDSSYIIRRTGLSAIYYVTHHTRDILPTSRYTHYITVRDVVAEHTVTIVYAGDIEWNTYMLRHEERAHTYAYTDVANANR